MSACTPGANDGTLNDTTEVVLVAAPSAAGVQRVVKSVTIWNADTVANTVKVYVKNSSSTRFLCQITLAVGDSLVFGEEDYIVLDSTAKSLCAKMSGSHTTTQPDFNACWADQA